MTVKPQGVVSDGQPGAREGQAGRRGVAEGFVVLMSPGIQRCSLFRGVGRSQAENCWSDIKSVTRWIVDRRVLHLLKMWLECPVEETDKRGRKTRTTEAKDPSRPCWRICTCAGLFWDGKSSGWSKASVPAL